jgi:hypothetical protein
MRVRALAEYEGPVRAIARCLRNAQRYVSVAGSLRTKCSTVTRSVAGVTALGTSTAKMATPSVTADSRRTVRIQEIISCLPRA